MNEKSAQTGGESRPDSFNCVDVYVNEPGDTTVRPIPPEQLERAKDLRDRIRAALAAGIDLSDQDVFIDEPGDTTVRPCDPKDLKRAMAERAKILAAQALQNQVPPQDAQEPGTNSHQ